MSEHQEHPASAAARRPDVLKYVIIGLLSFICLALVFGAGVEVGARKARYSYKWAESYHKNFAGPRGGFAEGWRKFPAGDLIGGHGQFGEVIDVSDDGFAVKGKDDVEFAVAVTDHTVVKGVDGATKVEVGDDVVVIGDPADDGRVDAKLVRVIGDASSRPPAPAHGSGFTMPRR